MYFIYLDEAGNTGKDLDNIDQPYHFISGIAIADCQMQKIENEISLILPKFFPYSGNFDFEFHGVDIIAGKSHFKHFKLSERLNLMAELVKIALENKIQIFCLGLNKKDHKAKYPNPIHPHNVCFMYLLEKIDNFLESENSKGVVIMDKCKNVEQSIINDCKYYRKNGTSFGFYQQKINHIVDNVMYVDSFNSYYMQLADCLTYIHTSAFVNKKLGKNNSHTREFIEKLALEIKPVLYYFKIK